MAVAEKNIIKDNDFVILKREDKLKVFKVKIRRQIFLDKAKFTLDGIIGHPYGTTFEVKDGQMVKVDRKVVAEQTSKAAEMPTDKDNRNLHDSDSNQKLSRDEIEQMKKEGISGEHLIGQLIENSTTFQEKTEYSQEKWVKKKKKKHLLVFTVLRPNTRLLCQMHVAQNIFKISNLRIDTLAQMMTHGNIRAGMTVAVVDTCMGLVTGAVLERLGGFGHVISFYPGEKIGRCILEMEPYNFSKEIMDTLHFFPLNQVKKLKQTTSLNGLASGDCSRVKSEDKLMKSESQSAEDKAVSLETQSEPFTSETQSEPVSSETQCEPVSSEIKSEPFTPETQCEPVSSETQCEPVSSEIKSEPFTPETQCEPVSSETQCEPVSSETQCEPVSSEIKSEPFTSETQCEPVSSEIKSEPVSSEIPSTENKPASLEAQSKAETASRQERTEHLTKNQKRAKEKKEKHMMQNKLHQEELKRAEIERKGKDLEICRNLLLQGKIDCLLVASKYHPTPIVTALQEYVAPSRQVIVFSQFLEAVEDCYVHVRQNGGMINFQVTETWLREYQVLPNRTHPVINMSGTGGYLLIATTVMNSS